MSHTKLQRKRLAIVVGSAFATSLAAGSVSAAQFDSNPFAMTELSGGYKVAQEGRCGEAKGGADKPEEKDAEGKCGETKSGADKSAQAQSAQGAAAKPEKKDAEGKCGEGKCGGSQ